MEQPPPSRQMLSSASYTTATQTAAPFPHKGCGWFHLAVRGRREGQAARHQQLVEAVPLALELRLEARQARLLRTAAAARLRMGSWVSFGVLNVMCPRQTHPFQGCWEAVVLPDWDGSKTAFAGSKAGFGRRKSGDLGPVRNRQRKRPGITKSFPTALFADPSIPGGGG
jgi:hypothetical protein